MSGRWHHAIYAIYAILLLVCRVSPVIGGISPVNITRVTVDGYTWQDPGGAGSPIFLPLASTRLDTLVTNHQRQYTFTVRELEDVGDAEQQALATENNLFNRTFLCWLDGGNGQPCTTPPDSNGPGAQQIIAVVGLLAEGAHEFCAVATHGIVATLLDCKPDTCGPQTCYYWYIDITPPASTSVVHAFPITDECMLDTTWSTFNGYATAVEAYKVAMDLPTYSVQSAVAATQHLSLTLTIQLSDIDAVELHCRLQGMTTFVPCMRASLANNVTVNAFVDGARDVDETPQGADVGLGFAGIVLQGLPTHYIGPIGTYLDTNTTAYTLEWYVIDGAGNIGETATFSWTIDRNVALVTIDAASLFDEGRGFSTLSAASISFALREPTTSIAQCRFTALHLDTDTDTDAGDRDPEQLFSLCTAPFAFNVVDQLVDGRGRFQLTIRAVDQAANTVPCQDVQEVTSLGATRFVQCPSYTFTIDLRRPQVTLNVAVGRLAPFSLEQFSASCFGTVLSDGTCVYQATSVTFQVVNTTSNGPLFTAECQLDAPVWFPCFPAAPTTLPSHLTNITVTNDTAQQETTQLRSRQLFGSLTDGTHMFKVRFTTSAGVVSPTHTLVITLDGTAPIATFTQTPALITSQTEATFRLESQSADPSTFTCQLDSHPAIDCTSTLYIGTALDAAGSGGTDSVWTPWKNQFHPDDATFQGGGDAESVSCRDLSSSGVGSPSQVATLLPWTVECRTAGCTDASVAAGNCTVVPAIDTQRVLRSPCLRSDTMGIVECAHSDQVQGLCLDYEIRALCGRPHNLTRLIVSAREDFELFLDGIAFTKGTSFDGPASIDIPYDIQIVAVRVTAFSDAHTPRLRVSLPFESLGSDTTWRCSNDPIHFLQPDWASLTFDDSSWTHARVLPFPSLSKQDDPASVLSDLLNTGHINAAQWIGLPFTPVSSSIVPSSTSQLSLFCRVALSELRYSRVSTTMPNLTHVDTELHSGIHTLRVWSTDAIGNTQVAATSHEWVVDTTPPKLFNAETPVPSNNYTLNVEVNDTVYRLNGVGLFPTLTVTLDGVEQPGVFCPKEALLCEGGARCKAYDVCPDDAALRIDTSNTTALSLACLEAVDGCIATRTMPLVTSATHGAHHAAVGVTDAAGNVGSALSLTWFVDAIAPTILLAQPSTHASADTTTTATSTTPAETLDVTTNSSVLIQAVPIHTDSAYFECVDAFECLIVSGSDNSSTGSDGGAKLSGFTPCKLDASMAVSCHRTGSAVVQMQGAAIPLLPWFWNASLNSSTLVFARQQQLESSLAKFALDLEKLIHQDLALRSSVNLSSSTAIPSLALSAKSSTLVTSLNASTSSSVGTLTQTPISTSLECMSEASAHRLDGDGTANELLASWLPFTLALQSGAAPIDPRCYLGNAGAVPKLDTTQFLFSTQLNRSLLVPAVQFQIDVVLNSDVPPLDTTESFSSILQRLMKWLDTHQDNVSAIAEDAFKSYRPTAVDTVSFSVFGEHGDPLNLTLSGANVSDSLNWCMQQLTLSVGAACSSVFAHVYAPTQHAVLWTNSDNKTALAQCKQRLLTLSDAVQPMQPCATTSGGVYFLVFQEPSLLVQQPVGRDVGTETGSLSAVLLPTPVTVAQPPVSIVMNVLNHTCDVANDPDDPYCLSEGEHTLLVRGVDGAGNTGATRSAAIRLDLTPPTLVWLQRPQPVSRLVVGSSGQVAGTGLVQFEYQSSEVNGQTPDTSTYYCYLFQNETLASLGLDAASDSVAEARRGVSTLLSEHTCQSSARYALVSGNYVFAANVRDGAGNLGEVSLYEFVLDAVPPSTAIAVSTRSGREIWTWPPALAHSNSTADILWVPSLADDDLVASLAASEPVTFWCGVRIDPCATPSQCVERLQGSNPGTLSLIQCADFVELTSLLEGHLDTTALYQAVTLVFRASDDAGNFDVWTPPSMTPSSTTGESNIKLSEYAVLYFVVDKQKPTTQIVLAPAPITAQPSSHFQFVAEEQGEVVAKASFECLLLEYPQVLTDLELESEINLGQWGACMAKLVVTTRTPNTTAFHYLVVRATDAASNVGNHSVYAWSYSPQRAQIISHPSQVQESLFPDGASDYLTSPPAKTSFGVYSATTSVSDFTSSVAQRSYTYARECVVSLAWWLPSSGALHMRAELYPLCRDAQVQLQLGCKQGTVLAGETRFDRDAWAFLLLNDSSTVQADVVTLNTSRSSSVFGEAWYRLSLSPTAHIPLIEGNCYVSIVSPTVDSSWFRASLLFSAVAALSVATPPNSFAMQRCVGIGCGAINAASSSSTEASCHRCGVGVCGISCFAGTAVGSTCECDTVVATVEGWPWYDSRYADGSSATLTSGKLTQLLLDDTTWQQRSTWEAASGSHLVTLGNVLEPRTTPRLVGYRLVDAALTASSFTFVAFEYAPFFPLIGLPELPLPWQSASNLINGGDGAGARPISLDDAPLFFSSQSLDNTTLCTFVGVECSTVTSFRSNLDRLKDLNVTGSNGLGLVTRPRLTMESAPLSPMLSISNVRRDANRAYIQVDKVRDVHGLSCVYTAELQSPTTRRDAEFQGSSELDIHLMQPCDNEMTCWSITVLFTGTVPSTSTNQLAGTYHRRCFEDNVLSLYGTECTLRNGRPVYAHETLFLPDTLSELHVAMYVYYDTRGWVAASVLVQRDGVVVPSTNLVARSADDAMTIRSIVQPWALHLDVQPVEPTTLHVGCGLCGGGIGGCGVLSFPLPINATESTVHISVCATLGQTVLACTSTSLDVPEFTAELLAQPVSQCTSNKLNVTYFSLAIMLYVFFAIFLPVVIYFWRKRIATALAKRHVRQAVLKTATGYGGDSPTFSSVGSDFEGVDSPEYLDFGEPGDVHVLGFYTRDDYDSDSDDDEVAETQML
eukprot:m.67859 g.67859  ORF g.67859 m.67859 type:complete len:2879 (+) comp12179_c0_seq1:86-8722(+)